MSELVTFGHVFRQVHAKSAGINDISPASPSGRLASCGEGKYAMSFTTDAVEFLNKDNKPAKFGWMQLAVILPGDLSLSSDKLCTFCDMEVPAGRIADIVGTVFAWAAAALFAYFIWTILYAVVIHPMIWLDEHLGFFGDILALIYLVGLFVICGWWLLAIVAGIFASGGAFSVFAHWLGRQFRPAIRFGLSKAYGKVDNGLHVINQDWISPPWNPQAARALDLILIGIKLRRRGLT